ncbi:MAG: alpha/beta hydrolase [Corynebacterium sp.]|uniref:alpha/beta fold hydrolase n=1 Tax=Corynebacterium sp. TaxID=1720 RepID=UPI0026DFDBD6|nr:alpha/beta hydrolase [Corynebacterium sp.]MDO5668493.1 alpha/beta hydrolase [Corynebacterium sp.]
MFSRRVVLSPSVVELAGPFEHVWVHTRGIRLHAAVAGDAGDPLVVLLHGSFSGWFEFREVIAPLAARGFRVAAVDARGFGMSDRPPATPGDGLRTAAGDIAGFIRASGYDSAVVVGADTGGTVAWALAAHYPDMVSALVSVSAAHPVDIRRAIAARPWHHVRTMARPGLPWFGLAAYRRHLAASTTPEFRDSPGFGEELGLRRKAASISNARPAIARTNRLLTAAVSARWLHPQVQAPTLLLQPPLPRWRHLTRRSVKRVAGDVTVRHIARSRDLPHLENPQGFVKTLAEFL